VTRAALLPPAPAVTRAARPAAGIVAVPVADLRRRPDHESELVDQALFGETVRVRRVASDRRWLLVELAEAGFAGWMRSWSLALGDAGAVARWRGRARRVVDRPWLERRDEPGGALPFGARVARGARGETLGPLGPIRLARGTADLPARGGGERGRRVVATARRFLGASYHWGGRTFAGLDCSGLVQLAARRHGILLPRDAREQCVHASGRARVRPFPASPAKGEPRPGDLWFFGPAPGKVTHVALSTGRLGLIHAYGTVKWGSLDPLSPVFEPELFRFVLGWQPLPKR
jgi:hypothetical protein